MALNKDVLGAALYSVAKQYNDIDADNLEAARTEFWKGVAGEIITHIINAAVVTVPGTGLAAPNGPVTGGASGKIS
jgi:hypothetical protein